MLRSPQIFASSPLRSTFVLRKVMTGKVSAAKKLFERRSASRSSLLVLTLAVGISTSMAAFCQESGSADMVPFTSLNRPGTLLTKWRIWNPTFECVLSMVQTAGVFCALAVTRSVGSSSRAAAIRTSTNPPGIGTGLSIEYQSQPPSVCSPVLPPPHQRQNGVHRHRLVILIGDFHIPVHHALGDLPLAILLRRLLLAREAHLDGVPDVHRLHEAEPLESVIREHGAGRWVDEQSRGRRQHEVSMGHTLLEDRLARGDVVHVRVEEVAGEARERDDVGLRDRAAMRDVRLADDELLEVFPKWMHKIAELIRASAPFPRHRRDRFTRPLNGGALHVVQHAADAAHLLTTAGATRAAVHEMRHG